MKKRPAPLFACRRLFTVDFVDNAGGTVRLQITITTGTALAVEHGLEGCWYQLKGQIERLGLDAAHIEPEGYELFAHVGGELVPAIRDAVGAEREEAIRKRLFIPEAAREWYEIYKGK